MAELKLDKIADRVTVLNTTESGEVKPVTLFKKKSKKKSKCGSGLCWLTKKCRSGMCCPTKMCGSGMFCPTKSLCRCFA